MILSVIICKRNRDVFEKCVESIKNTLNIPYELIVIDNSTNTYNIFTAYNEGINRSSGDVMCFMHEDVICHEQDWDKKVVSHFKNDSDLGMIGVAGGASFHKFAWSWNQTYYKKDFAVSLASKKDDKLIHTTNGFKSETKQVLIVDGLWFCIKREVLINNRIRFDTDTYNGFHRYDYDISMQIAQVAKIKVVSDIKLEHKSSGTRNKNWMKANIAFQKKWSNYLPCGIEEGETGIISLKSSGKDLQALFKFVYLMAEHNFNMSQIRKIIISSRCIFKGKAITQIKLVLIYVFGIKTIMKFKKRFN